MNSLLIAQNIIKRALRSRKEFAALLILPILAVLVMSFVINQSSTQSEVSVGLMAEDHGVFAQHLSQRIEQQPGIHVLPLEKSTYKAAVEDKKALLVVEIPAGFSEDISQGREVTVPMHYNEASPTGTALTQVINQYVGTLYKVNTTAVKLSEETGESLDSLLQTLLTKVDQNLLTVQSRLPNSQEDTPDFSSLTSSIGFVVLFMMILIFTTMGTLLEDKKQLTLARMFVSPVKEWEIILGNLLGSLALGILQLIPITLVLQGVFHIPWGMGLAALFLILLCFVVASIGLGIGLSGFIKGAFNPTLIIATVIVPTSILGGCFIPESMMPDFMNKLGYAVPQKWVMDAIGKVLTGSGILDIALNLGIILMFGLAFATFGLKTLRPLQD